MSKELECLKRLIYVIGVLQETINKAEEKAGTDTSIDVMTQSNKDGEIIEQALTEYEALKNAEPSEALECLEKIYSRLPQWDLSRNIDQCNIIKQVLIQKSKKEQAWDIVKEMQLSTLNIIGKCNLYEDYLTFYDFKKNMGNPLKKQLTKEEFNLLKEAMGE